MPKILCKPPRSDRKNDFGGLTYGKKRTQGQQQAPGADGGVWRQINGGRLRLCEDAYGIDDPDSAGRGA